jgi:hypothetical protein
MVQRATAQSKTGMFRDYGAAEAPPGFQAGWSDCMSDCMYFTLFLFILLGFLFFLVFFLTDDDDPRQLESPSS